MQTLKQDDHVWGYRIVNTGLEHPVDSEPIEIDFNRRAGAWYARWPGRNDPDTEVEIAHEPSVPEDRRRIDEMKLFALAAWIVAEARDYYAPNTPGPQRPYTPPSPASVRAFLKAHGLTGAAAARRGYLSGGQAVRKYTGGQQPHRVPGAVWFAWHAHQLLDAETLARIEAAMAASARQGEERP